MKAHEFLSLRKSYNLTQKQFAYALGLSSGVIGRIEIGKNRVTDNIMNRINELTPEKIEMARVLVKKDSTKSQDYLEYYAAISHDVEDLLNSNSKKLFKFNYKNRILARLHKMTRTMLNQRLKNAIPDGF